MQDRAGRPFPLVPLIGAGSVMALTIVAALVGRMTGAGVDPPSGRIVAERNLRFVDRQDGGVTVIDMRDGRPVEIVDPGSNGFLRATVRGLAQQRKREDLGDNAPFRLTAWADGRLTLLDSATGRQVELEAFGVSNEQAFAQLLPMRTGAP